MAKHAFRLDQYDAGYFFLTGVGTIIGITIAELIIVAATTKITTKYTWDELYTLFHFHILLCIAIGFSAGTLWQVNVNIGLYLGFNFTEAFFFMFALTFLIFMVAVSTVREVNGLLPEWARLRLQKTDDKLWYDVTLGLAVAAADAFFVGTDNNEYTPHGWLRGFACTAETPIFVEMCFAGLSSFCGFLIIQTIMNCILVDVWLDGYKFDLHPYIDEDAGPVETTATVTPVGEATALISGSAL